MSWIKDIFDPGTRKWEDFYRNRWQHDKIVRSTHGVNCQVRRLVDLPLGAETCDD